jgi:hypothetical protein
MKKEFLISTIISSVACLISIVALIFALLPYTGTDDGLDENPQGLQFLMQSDGTYIVSCGDAKHLSNIIIPATYKGSTVTGIDERAFAYCDSLISITIPDSVTSIGKSAFQNCSSLTSIIIPDSVTSIGDFAFWNCGALTNVTISNSVTSIGDSLFDNCESLSSIIIPNSVTSIGQDAFLDCSSLTTINFVGTVKQWNAIEKGWEWNDHVPATYIQCSDGTVPLK